MSRPLSSSNMALSDHIFPFYPLIPLSIGFSYHKTLHTMAIPIPVNTPLASYISAPHTASVSQHLAYHSQHAKEPQGTGCKQAGGAWVLLC